VDLFDNTSIGRRSAFVRCGSSRVVHDLHHHGGGDADHVESACGRLEPLLAENGC